MAALERTSSGPLLACAEGTRRPVPRVVTTEAEALTGPMSSTRESDAKWLKSWTYVATSDCAQWQRKTWGETQRESKKRTICGQAERGGGRVDGAVLPRRQRSGFPLD